MQPPTESPAILCQQCGLLHPPVAGICPMKKEMSVTGETIDLGEFLRTISIIMTTNIKKKEIRDIKKLCGKIIVEVTKNIELYIE